MLPIIVLLTEPEVNNCFSIFTRSDLNRIRKETIKKEFICLQIKMFMSPSHATIYVSLLRGALITSHAFTFNIGNRQGRTVSRVEFDTK